MEEKKEEGKCGNGGCGIHCSCCVCKAMKGLVLLLIGGAIGYGIGHCRSHSMCSMPAAAQTQTTAPVPASPKTAK